MTAHALPAAPASYVDSSMITSAQAGKPMRRVGRDDDRDAGCKCDHRDAAAVGRSPQRGSRAVVTSAPGVWGRRGQFGLGAHHDRPADIAVCGEAAQGLNCQQPGRHGAQDRPIGASRFIGAGAMRVLRSANATINARPHRPGRRRSSRRDRLMAHRSPAPRPGGCPGRPDHDARARRHARALMGEGRGCGVDDADVTGEEVEVWPMVGRLSDRLMRCQVGRTQSRDGGRVLGKRCTRSDLRLRGPRGRERLGGPVRRDHRRAPCRACPRASRWGVGRSRPPTPIPVQRLAGGSIADQGASSAASRRLPIGGVDPAWATTRPRAVLAPTARSLGTGLGARPWRSSLLPSIHAADVRPVMAARTFLAAVAEYGGLPNLVQVLAVGPKPGRYR